MEFKPQLWEKWSSKKIIEAVQTFAEEAHGEQTRKYTGEPYIHHPISVAQLLSYYPMIPFEMLCAALLHDVLEDTTVTSGALLSFLHGIEDLTPKKARHIHKLVVELTDVYTKEYYPTKNREERKELEAQRLGEVSHNAKIIKYFDLIDNEISIKKYDPNFYKVFKREAKRVFDYLEIEDIEGLFKDET